MLPLYYSYCRVQVVLGGESLFRINFYIFLCTYHRSLNVTSKIKCFGSYVRWRQINFRHVLSYVLYSPSSFDYRSVLREYFDTHGWCVSSNRGSFGWESGTTGNGRIPLYDCTCPSNKLYCKLRTSRLQEMWITWLLMWTISGYPGSSRRHRYNEWGPLTKLSDHLNLL